MWRRLFFVLVVGAARLSQADVPQIASLRPGSGEGDCLDIVDSKRPLIRECDDSAPNQQWKLRLGKGSFYRLSPRGAGDQKCLDIVNDGKANNRVTLVDCANASGQHWKLTPADDGYALTTEWRGDRLCLDATSEGMKSQLLLTDCADKASQRWRLSAAASADQPDSAAVDHDHIPVDPKSKFDPDFVVVFDACRLVMRSADNSSRAGHSRSVTVACARSRAKGKTLTCKANPGNQRAAFEKSRYVFSAVATEDTATALSFGSSNTLLGSLEISVNPKSRAASLKVSSAGEPVECSGGYATAAEATKLNSKLDAEDAQLSREMGADSRESTAVPGPAPQGPCKARGQPVVKNPNRECCSRDSKLVKGQRTCL